MKFPFKGAFVRIVIAGNSIGCAPEIGLSRRPSLIRDVTAAWAEQRVTIVGKRWNANESSEKERKARAKAKMFGDLDANESPDDRTKLEAKRVEGKRRSPGRRTSRADPSRSEPISRSRGRSLNPTIRLLLERDQLLHYHRLRLSKPVRLIAAQTAIYDKPSVIVDVVSMDDDQ